VALAAGVKAATPILLGAIPFGLAVGVAAIEAGLSPAQGMATSLLIFAGAAQLAAIQLVDSGLPLLMLVTALVINLRLAIYSASLAPHLQHLSGRWRWLLAYFLTDQAYAVSLSRYQAGMARADKHWYYLGAGASIWLVYQLVCAIGLSIGASVPSNWSLDFIIPLTFLGLLVPTVRDRGTLIAALTGGLAAILLIGMPLKLGMLAAALLGICAGLLVEPKPANATSTGD
jgi:4-azaleucine resistance transporter AzlC